MAIYLLGSRPVANQSWDLLSVTVVVDGWLLVVVITEGLQLAVVAAVHVAARVFVHLTIRGVGLSLIAASCGSHRRLVGLSTRRHGSCRTVGRCGRLHAPRSRECSRPRHHGVWHPVDHCGGHRIRVIDYTLRAGGCRADGCFGRFGEPRKRVCSHPRHHEGCHRGGPRICVVDYTLPGHDIKLLKPLARGASRFGKLLARLTDKIITYWTTACDIPTISNLNTS